MRLSKILVMIIVCMLGAGIFAIADPVGVREFTGESDSTADLGGMTAKTNDAQAGNVTALVANTTLITKTWQGYYGNVTGKIVLDNANNKSMYDWDVTTPSGTVFAVTETVSAWSDVICFDFVNDTETNITTLETSLGCDANDGDCVDETFDTTTHDALWVGTNSFTNECNATKTYVNDGTSTSFDEILLYEPASDAVIYATVIHAAATNFENGKSDFQLLVGENGHGASASTKTTYFFYLEIT